MYKHLLLLAPLLVAGLTGQGTIVSPASCAGAEGDTQNLIPFGQTTPRRYLQIHGDLGTTPRVISKLTFRITTPAAVTNYNVTRTHDLEIHMGHATPNAVARPNFAFDANYAGPKTLVLPRQFVTFGPTGTSVTPGPQPFLPTLEITLATPFVYNGVAPLIWEVTYFGSTATPGSEALLDADVSTNFTSTSTISGFGCAPVGSAMLMTHTYPVADVRGTVLMNGTIAGAPPNSTALMAIGFTNPNLVMPELCAPLRTDAVVLQVLGNTTATGTFTHDTPTGAIVLPNTAPGGLIYTQAFVLDPNSAFTLPVTASNGRVSVIPPIGIAQVNNVTRLYNTIGGTSATHALFNAGTVGYGLATQFTYL